MNDSLWNKLLHTEKAAKKASNDLETAGGHFLIVGLGNPGRQYKDTRHNVGFMLADQLSKQLETSFSRVMFRALVAEARFAGHRIKLVKPQTYMNESGQAVGSLVRFYKVPVDRLLVAHDDVDLPVGTLRLRPGGGSAGQKGVQSIIDRLGTQNFPRLRIGVGRPPGQMPAAAYVLQEFSRADAGLLPQILQTAAEAALLFVTDGMDSAMNRYNGSLDE